MKRLLILFGIILPVIAVSAQPHLNQSLGSFTSMDKGTDGITVHTSFGTMKVTVYSPTVIRIQASKTGDFDDFSYAVIAKPSGSTFLVSDKSGEIQLVTDSLDVRISKEPVRVKFLTRTGALINEDDPSFGISWIGNEVACYKKLEGDEKFIGLGEKTGNLNRRGEAYTNWNKDYFAYPSNGDPLYETIPFYMGLHDGLSYGIFFDNSYKSVFNFGASNNRFSFFWAEDGEMNYYFIYHHHIDNIITSYTWLTGRMEMPPLWSLGFQQCRYSYYPDTEVLRIAKTFREKSIPADALYLDIHYMDHYKIFTWNPERFPDPPGMLNTLKGMGFHTVVIVDPGIKVEKGYPQYEQGVKDSLFLTYPDKTYFTGQVWPGWCHFPDFTNPRTRTWWGQSFKGYVQDGVTGFWNDMNEPSSWGQQIPDLVQFNFEGNKGTMRRGHNVYGMEMARSTFEGTKALMNGDRPFILTRAGYSGVQRYSAVWTGDNQANDDHMLAGVRLVNSLGLAGVSFTGMDIAGFTGNASPELYARWISLGTFTPLYRAHTMINTKSAEPWAFGEAAEEVARNYIRLRYRLVPYLYSEFYNSHTSGIPVNRTLAIAHPDDDRVFDGRYQNEFMFGDAFLVTPSESYRDITPVYLPAGTWYDLYNDTKYTGKSEHLIPSPVDRLPVFVEGGSIIPMESVVQNLGEAPSDTLFLHVYAGMLPHHFTYYEDDGISYQYQQGVDYIRTITYDPAARTLTFERPTGTFKSKFKTVKLILHGFTLSKEAVTIGGKQKTLTSEHLGQLKPLSNFDPTGQGGQGEYATVETISIPNSSDKILVGW